MAKRKRNKKEQTFDVYPYLGGTQHFMIGGATPRLHKLQDGKEEKDGIVEDKVTYEKPTGYRQFLTDYNVSPSSPSLLGQVGSTLSAGSDLLDQWGGVLNKNNYKPGGKYSKWGPDGLRYGNISLTNTRDENALVDVENMMKYVNMNTGISKLFNKNKRDNVISSDIWKTPDEMTRGHWDWMNLDEDGRPTFKGLDFEVSKKRSEQFTHPDKGTCSKPEFTNGADCEANGGVWTGEKLFGIKTRNEDGSFTYRDEDGVPITTGPGSKGTIYDQIEDKKGPGGLYDANADILQFDFDKGTCDDGVSTTMEDCAAAGGNWIKDENSLSKVRHYGEDEKGVIDEHVVDYDPDMNFSDWETKSVVKTSKQDEINCQLSGCNGAPGKWVVTEAGGHCDCGGGPTNEDNVGGGCASMNLCDDPNNPGECIPCEQVKYGAELPKAQFGYFGSRDGRSNLNQSLKIAGTTALASMGLRGLNTGITNRRNYRNAYDDYINLQGPDWYEEMCTEQGCPSWEENRLELLDGHPEPNFAWFRGTNDNLFGKNIVMNKNNVLQKGDLADAYWQNIKQGVKDGITTGIINYGKNWIFDNTGLGRWWDKNVGMELDLGWYNRKFGGDLPKYQDIGETSQYFPYYGALNKEGYEGPTYKQSMGTVVPKVDAAGNPVLSEDFQIPFRPENYWETELVNWHDPKVAYWLDQPSYPADRTDVNMNVDADDMLYRNYWKAQDAAYRVGTDEAIDKFEDAWGRSGSSYVRKNQPVDMSRAAQLYRGEDYTDDFNIKTGPVKEDGTFRRGGSLPKYQGPTKSEVKAYREAWNQGDANFSKKNVQNILQDYINQGVDLGTDTIISSQYYTPSDRGRMNFVRGNARAGNVWNDIFSNISEYYDKNDNIYTFSNFPKLEEGGGWWDGVKDWWKETDFETPINKGLDYAQTTLTGAGLTPGAGIIPDAINTVISAGRAGYSAATGDEEGANKHTKKIVENAASMIPIAGQAVGTVSLANDMVNYASSGDGTTTNPNDITMKDIDPSNVTRYGRELTRLLTGGDLPKFPVGGPFVDDLEEEGVTDQNTQIEEEINPFDPYETGRAYAKFGGSLPKFQGDENSEVDEELDAEEETFIEPEGKWATVNVGGVQTKVPFDQRMNYSAIPGQENSNPEMAGLDYQRAVNVANQSNDPGVEVNYGDNWLQQGWNKTREALNTGIVGGLLDGVIGGAATEAQCSDQAYTDKSSCEAAGEKWTEATKGTGLVNFAFENLLPMANNIIGQNRQHQYELSKQGMSSENFASTMESSTNRNTMGTKDINKGGYGDDLYGTGEVFGQLAQQGIEMPQEPQKDFSALTTFMNLVNDKEDVRFNTEELKDQKLYNGKMQRGGEPGVNQIINDPTFRIWYARNAGRSDVMNASANPEQLKVLFLIDIGMSEAPIFSNEIDAFGNVDKSNRGMDVSLRMLDNPIEDSNSPMINWQEGMGGRPKMNMGGNPDIMKAMNAQANPMGAAINAIKDGTATNSMNAWFSGDMNAWENAGPMRDGGQVLDIDDAMLKELISAGVDIEIL